MDALLHVQLFGLEAKWPMIKKKKSWHAKVHPSTLPGNAF
jgi:hypothetical protein